MQILVFNSGSSSLKFKLFEAAGAAELKLLAKGLVSSFGPSALCAWTVNGNEHEARTIINDHREATGWVFELLQATALPPGSLLDAISAVGHRVVHGGDRFSAPARISDQVLVAIESLETLAPLHNAASVSVMRASQSRLGPDIPMVAVFDTAFHHTLPDYVRAYALPSAWTGPFGIKRYGFHGIAHRYLYERYHQINGGNPWAHRLITLQLGNGCSMTAIRGTSPVETSMGFTPMEGLIMATRPGDVDAGVLLHLAAQGGFSVDQLREGLNQRSGLLGLSGVSADMRELLNLETAGHAGAKLAVNAFCHRVRKYLGAYLAILGGAEAIIFGGGIGEHSPQIRARVCADMDWCGLTLDPERNRMAYGIETCISTDGASCQVYVIPVDEESIIARETYTYLHQQGKASQDGS